MNRAILLLVLCVLTVACSKAQQFNVVRAFANLQFDNPVGLYHAGDGTNRLFVVEQPGWITTFDNTASVNKVETFLDITDRVVSGGEMGLLGLAFAPDFATSGNFYVDYTRRVNTGNGQQLQTAISRFHVNTATPNHADSLSEEVLLTIDQPYENHNGGQIAFGPDGYLYIGMGDGGGGGDPTHSGQDRSKLLGKILRIDVTTEPTGGLKYVIPADNPFVGNTQGWRPEIYSYGMRNPWRFSFDPVTGKLWCGDVGQNLWEEISIIVKGGNYGWNVMEGFHCYQPSSGCDTTGKILPIWEYPHDTTGGSSITGGFVYRGTRTPSLSGRYIYADLSGKIWALQLMESGEVINTLLRKTTMQLVSFGVDANNELYVCAYNGRIYSITETSGVDDGPDESSAPMAQLDEVTPNPMREHGTIAYALRHDAHVRLDIVNVAGRSVRTLADGLQGAGPHRMEWDAGALADGAYFCRISIGNQTISRRFVLVR